VSAPLDHRQFSRRRQRRWPLVLGGLGTAAAVLLAVIVVQQAISAVADEPRQAVLMLSNPKGDSAKGAIMARRLLRDDPLRASLLSALGLAADRRGDQNAASGLMNSSGALSWRDVSANAWLFQHQFESGDFVRSMLRADALIRTRPETADKLYPILATAAANRGVGAALATRLAEDPFWRAGFIQNLSIRAEPAVTFSILSQLQSSGAPVTVDESSDYVRRLIDLKRYDEALLGVMLLLPNDRRSSYQYLYNGDFNKIQGIMPFDWAINPVAGVSITMETSPQRNMEAALHIYSDGDSTGKLMQQVIVLTPGAYHLGALRMSPTPATSQRLQWSVRCLDGPVLLKTTDAATEQWKRFSDGFVVPETGCGGQSLELLPTPADRRAAVEVWYDKIAVTRDENP
jgi:hypothetical protein